MKATRTALQQPQSKLFSFLSTRSSWTLSQTSLSFSSSSNSPAYHSPPPPHPHHQSHHHTLTPTHRNRSLLQLISLPPYFFCAPRTWPHLCSARSPRLLHSISCSALIVSTPTRSNLERRTTHSAASVILSVLLATSLSALDSSQALAYFESSNLAAWFVNNLYNKSSGSQALVCPSFCPLSQLPPS